MVAAAGRRNLDWISITEHISQIREIRNNVTFKSTHSSGRMFQNLAEYVGEFSQTRIDSDRVRIRKGLEVDYIRNFDGLISRFVSAYSWDILLCSVHEMNDSDVERAFREDSAPAIRNRWEEYVNREIEAVSQSEIPFQVLTHPVRLAAGTPEPDDLPELLSNLARSSRSHDKALELNGKDLKSYPKLVRILAAACAKSGCRVSFGSDAHHPSEVGRGIEQAIQLANEFKLHIF